MTTAGVLLCQALRHPTVGADTPTADADSPSRGAGTPTVANSSADTPTAGADTNLCLSWATAKHLWVAEKVNTLVRYLEDSCIMGLPLCWLLQTDGITGLP